ncbi:hypothetical protein Tco_0471791 [Tanacetum coccineum]
MMKNEEASVNKHNIIDAHARNIKDASFQKRTNAESIQVRLISAQGSTEAEGEIGGGPVSEIVATIPDPETIKDRGFNKKRDYGMRLLTFGDPSDQNWNHALAQNSNVACDEINWDTYIIRPKLCPLSCYYTNFMCRNAVPYATDDGYQFRDKLEMSFVERPELFTPPPDEAFDKRGDLRRKSIKLQPANTRIRGFEYLSENKLGRCSKWGWTEDVLGVVKIVEPHSGRLYLRTHYEHKTLALMSVGLNAMVPVAVGGGVGGDNFWVVGPRNEFRSGYSGSGRGSGICYGTNIMVIRCSWLWCVGFCGLKWVWICIPVGSTGQNMRPRFLNECTRTDVANCIEVSQTLKTHTSSAAPKGTSSDVRGTSSSCGKRKPHPQLDSYGFQMQRESDARNISVNSTLPALRDVNFGDETEQIHAMTEMNGRLCSTRRMRIRLATTKMLLIDNGIRRSSKISLLGSIHLEFDMCALQHVTLENLESLEIVSVSKELLFSMSLHSSKKDLLFSTTNDEGCRFRCFCYSYDDGCSDTLALCNMGCLDIAASCNGTSSPLKSQQELCESASLSKEIKKFAECLQQCVVARKYSAVRKALLFQEGRKQATLTVVTRRWEWCLMDMGASVQTRSNQTISIDRNIRRRLTTTPSHNTVDATALLAPSKLHVHTAVDGTACIFLTPSLPMIPLYGDDDLTTTKFIQAEVECSSSPIFTSSDNCRNGHMISPLKPIKGAVAGTIRFLISGRSLLKQCSYSISEAGPPSIYIWCMKWPPTSASMIIGPLVHSSSSRGGNGISGLGEKL